MVSALWFFTGLAAIIAVLYIGFSMFEAVHEYRLDRWARGNWVLRLYWRYLSHTPAARQRRGEFVALVGLLILLIGPPVAWLTGAIIAWHDGTLTAYLEWTDKGFELLGKVAEVVSAFKK